MRTTNYVPQSRNGNGHLDPCAYEWGTEPLLHPDDIPDWLGRRRRGQLSRQCRAVPAEAERPRRSVHPAEPWSRGAPIARVTDAPTFLRAYAPISYTIEGVLPSGYLYGITARQGGGKTAFMIAASMAVILGNKTIIDCEVKQGRVAYVTIENPTDFRMKLAVNCYVHGVSYDAIAPLLAIIDGRGPPGAIIEGLRLDAEANGPFQLVCFDTFQAGFAAAGGVEFNDNAAVLKFLLSLRQITVLPGSPSALIAFHPTKNAGEESLVPYGGGSIMNEVDGNLTIWVEAPCQLKFHWNRVRGPEFEPRYFRIEKLSCPEIVDKQGRQILMPVLRPTTAQAVEEREAVESKTDIAFLRALMATPEASQRDLALAIGLSVGAINKKIQRLEKAKMVEHGLNAKSNKAIKFNGVIVQLMLFTGLGEQRPSVHRAK